MNMQVDDDGPTEDVADGTESTEDVADGFKPTEDVADGTESTEDVADGFKPTENLANGIPLSSISSELVANWTFVNLPNEAGLLSAYRGHDSVDRVGTTGDIIYPSTQLAGQGWNLWPEKNIPYMYDSGVEEERNITIAADESRGIVQEQKVRCVSFLVEKAMFHLSQATGGCIQFHRVASANESDISPLRIRVDTHRECSATLGYQASGNFLTVGNGCKNFGTVIHLLGHAVGLAHSHQRTDALKHISFISQNLIEADYDYTPLFTPLAVNNTNSEWTKAMNKQPYDVTSIMHWGSCHYSKTAAFGGLLCDHTLDQIIGADSEGPIGNRGQLTQVDALVLMDMYKCPVWPEGWSMKDSIPDEGDRRLMGGCFLADKEDFKWFESTLDTVPEVEKMSAGHEERKRKSVVRLCIIIASLIALAFTGLGFVVWRRKVLARKMKNALAAELLSDTDTSDDDEILEDGTRVKFMYEAESDLASPTADLSHIDARSTSPHQQQGMLPARSEASRRPGAASSDDAPLEGDKGKSNIIDIV